MRVLFVANTFPPDYTGGAEVSLYHTARGLADRGYQCSVLSMNSSWPEIADEWYDLDGITVHKIRHDSRWKGSEIFDRRFYRATLQEIDELQPDIVNIHNVSGASPAPFVAGRRRRIPTVAMLHDLWLLCPNNMRMQQDGSFCEPARYPDGCGRCYRGYDYWAAIPGRRNLMMRMTSAVRYFISPSQALIERHVEAGFDRSRFRLIRLGFENAITSDPIRTEVRSAVKLGAHYPLIVFGGGGVDVKGAQVVLDAVPTLLKQIPDLRILVAGRGDAEILHGFQRHAPNVVVLGSVPFSDMRNLFAAADLTLIPSTCHENSPVTIYESFQVGTPLVGSRIGGIPELIREGETGYLFPVGDAAALAAQILRFFALPAAERRAMRRRCYGEAQHALTLDRHLDALQTLYAEVVNPEVMDEEAVNPKEVNTEEVNEEEVNAKVVN